VVLPWSTWAMMAMLRSFMADIEAIRDAYIKAFTQDAVLRTDRATCADF
jgi:hypothetical protein